MNTTGTYHSGAALAHYLTTNIKLVLKGLIGSNNLAYLSREAGKKKNKVLQYLNLVLKEGEERYANVIKRFVSQFNCSDVISYSVWQVCSSSSNTSEYPSWAPYVALLIE